MTQQFSHSRVECFRKCKYQFKLRYIDKVKTLPPTDANNALILGTALHKGIETDVKTAIKEYYNSFPIIDDLVINEAIKLEDLIPKVKAILPKGTNEIKIENQDFVSFLDLITPNPDGSFDLYDFKYSNNVRNYLESGQLHEYKYFFESQTGKKINKMFFVFVPKIQIRQKKTEDLIQLRKRLKADLAKSFPRIVEIPFDYRKVIDFYAGIKEILEAKEFPKNPTRLCDWCDYQQYCEEGIDFMLLPQNKRRNIEKIEKKVIWLYGAPFSGKTHLANQFPDPLMLNTDGNVRFVDAPYIAIKNVVTVEGRITKTTPAWEVFKDAISELEKKQNDFKTIVVDLLEDVYEHCRVFLYEREGITHESDNSFKYYDMVRTEFLSTLKRLMNLDYENIILISHEDTSKDITKKSGDKFTTIKPNLTDKTAMKVAGMVDIVARVVADDNVRTLNFKTNEVIFGGGRLDISAGTIPLEYNELMKVYEEANVGKAEAEKKAEPAPNPTPDESNPEPANELPQTAASEPTNEPEAKADAPKERKRRTRA